MMANKSKIQLVTPPAHQGKYCSYIIRVLEKFSDDSNQPPIDDSDTAFEYSSTEGSSSIDKSGDDSSTNDSKDDDSSTDQSVDNASTDKNRESVESNSAGEEYLLSGSSNEFLDTSLSNHATLA
jgi:hypothetical protein